MGCIYMIASQQAMRWLGARQTIMGGGPWLMGMLCQFLDRVISGSIIIRSPNVLMDWLMRLWALRQSLSQTIISLTTMRYRSFRFWIFLKKLHKLFNFLKCGGVCTGWSLKVMLLGHSDSYVRDKAMQVTIAFNHFGTGLIQRMPR